MTPFTHHLKSTTMYIYISSTRNPVSILFSFLKTLSFSFLPINLPSYYHCQLRCAEKHGGRYWGVYPQNSDPLSQCMWLWTFSRQ